MDKMKLVLVLIVLLLAAIGSFIVFKLLWGLISFLLVAAVVVLVVGVAVKALGKSERPRSELEGAELELQRADNLLEELKRKQLTK
jgi:large-conductance mechanosensitive channel